MIYVIAEVTPTATALAFNGYAKIGYTDRSPESRLRSLQTGNPRRLALIAEFPGDVADEKHLHYVLMDRRIGGEWFYLNQAWIDAICAPVNSVDEFCDAIGGLVRLRHLDGTYEHWQETNAGILANYTADEIAAVEDALRVVGRIV